MAKVITVNIQKGGVGKTTTVHEFASCLTSEGNRVLAIDLDQQCNLTRISGAKIFNNDEINGNKDMPSILGVLTGDYPFNTCIQHTENYDIAIAHRDFKDAEKIFGEWDDVYRLQLVMEEIRNDYDYIIIDTPPSLGILPSMALTAADYVVIPCEASASGIQGLGQLYERIEKVRHEKRGTNKNLKLAGLLLNMFDPRKVLDKSMKQQLKVIAENMNTKIFDTYIHSAIAVRESQSWRQSLIEYSPTSKPTADYKAFTKEFLQTIKEMN